LSGADDKGQVIGSFSNFAFSGYIGNGSIVLNQVCFYNDTTCKVVRVYVVTEILANTWFFGISGGNGIVGVGPNSAFIRRFVDVATNTQTFSIVVGRGTLAPVSGTLGASTTAATNITFGASNDPYYSNMTSLLNLTANSTTGSYSLSTSQSGVLGLGFGQA